MKKNSQHLEDNCLLNPGYYGGQPNYCATNPVIVDVIQTKITMITRKPLIWCNNDLK